MPASPPPASPRPASPRPGRQDFTPYMSLIVPVYNEAENLPRLYSEIVAALAACPPWELICVDDGSQDSSLETLKKLAAEHNAGSGAQSRFFYLSFTQNQGQSAAFSAGFRVMRGQVAVTLDSDLQNDPADIPAMLALYEQGWDMVAGWRAKRRDIWIKRKSSRIANAVRNRLVHETIRDTGCSLKVMRAAMLREIPMFTGMHRFFPALMRMQGARIVEIPVNHRPRVHGRSKYGVLDRAFSAFYDLLAVRWMQKRHFCGDIKDQNLDSE